MNDPLFVGLTRPAMLLRVSYSGVLINILITMVCFLNLDSNPFCLLMLIPIHIVMVLLSINEPRFFELGIAWLKTRARAKHRKFWKGASYGG